MPNPSHARYVCLLVLLFCASGCNKAGGRFKAESSQGWRSEHFNVSARAAEGWSSGSVNAAGDTYDRENGLLKAFLHKQEGLGFVIKIEPDVSFEALSMSDYLSANKRLFLSNPEYELVDEADIQFHGRPFHRFRFRVKGRKGMGANVTHIHRDGRQLVVVQWTFPIRDKADVSEPNAIREFDRGVRLPFEFKDTSGAALERTKRSVAARVAA